ncbi:MAG TPA: hypothetical protein VFS77_00970 [Pyrinomonadaceae bacterium]|nr:hypothetical protein [Pyrinomonadaceae bacterium]
MPFKAIGKLPEEPPSVRILLTGQLILRPNDTSVACEVFVNRSAPNHHLTVEVREKAAGKADVILMRHYGALGFLDPANRVEGMQILRRLSGEDPEPFSKVEQYSGPATDYAEPLNLALDLNDKRFFPGKKLLIDHECARPSIMIRDGIFHTAAKTSNDIEVHLMQGERPVRKLPAFASVIGANVYLNNGESLILRWCEMAVPRTLTLEKPPKGVSYEVFIINDPLYDDPREGRSHDELGEYYKILPSVDTSERLAVKVKFPATVAATKGSAKAPCMPVIVSGP